MKKKWGYFLLCILMLNVKLAIAAIIASGDDCGENCHWEIDDETKTLTITGSGAMKDYERDCSPECTTSAPWRAYRSQVQNLNIGEGITTIGYDSFEDMNYTKEVTLPSTLTAIGALAFHSMTALNGLTIPDKVTTIGEHAMSHSSLSYLVLPENLEQVKNFAFGGNQLKSIVIPENFENLNINVFKSWDGQLKPIEELYCSRHHFKICTAMAEKLSAVPILYTKMSDGSYLIGDKRYYSLSDISFKKGVTLKKIYTVDEATKALGKNNRNTFSIRYR